MDQSAAEQQLLQLLRGLDVPEFSLLISLKEKHSDPAASGGRGWHLLQDPVWTITMSVPEVPGDRTTTSGVSFEEAWQRQDLWWRLAPRKGNPPAGPDYRQVMSADSIQRAETQFLGTVRGEAGGEFAVTVAANASNWVVSLRVPGRTGEGATGDGASFAYAWYHDRPWWQGMSGGSLQ
jgi:hypothetical protein